MKQLRDAFSSAEMISNEIEITEPSRNRESLDSPPPVPQTSSGKGKMLTRRTDWYVESEPFLLSQYSKNRDPIYLWHFTSEDMSHTSSPSSRQTDIYQAFYMGHPLIRHHN